MKQHTEHPQQQHKSTLERFKSNPYKTRDPNTPGLLPHLLSRQLPKSRHDGRQSVNDVESAVDTWDVLTTNAGTGRRRRRRRSTAATASERPDEERPMANHN